MVSRDEILGGHDKQYPLTPELEQNLTKLLLHINMFRAKYNLPMHVNSGYRPAEYNKSIGGASDSSHITCQAVDFADSSREITRFVLANPGILVDCDLWMEDPSATPTWIHLSIRPVASGMRIFKP